MNNQTIADVYAANDKIREKLKQTIENVSDEAANFLSEDEKWSIAHLVEHISLVEEGMSKISAKLLMQARAEGQKADGQANLSENFITKAAEAKSRNAKFEAPEPMRPTGSQTIAESLARMEENRHRLEELRPLFESFECSNFTFPHPSFGAMTAHDWLTLIGGHEARHLKQLEKLIEKSAVKTE